MYSVLRYILMIDDDPDDVMFFRDALAAVSPETKLLCIEDGDRVLEFLADHGNDPYPDVIFMDINMPAMNGWECLREIKKLVKYNRIPIVMFSTMNFQMHGLSPTDVGAAAFLTKADSMDRLKNNLINLFDTLFPNHRLQGAADHSISIPPSGKI